MSVFLATRGVLGGSVIATLLLWAILDTALVCYFLRNVEIRPDLALRNQWTCKSTVLLVLLETPLILAEILMQQGPNRYFVIGIGFAGLGVYIALSARNALLYAENSKTKVEKGGDQTVM